MNDYLIIELQNGIKCIVIDVLDYKDKQYFLLSKMTKDETIISENFDICIYNESKNYFEKIENELEYDLVYALFEKKNQKQKSINDFMQSISNNQSKFKIVGIDDYNYTFESVTGEKIIKNIEFYTENKPKLNSYIYISENIINDKTSLQYGAIKDFNKITEDEIIKIVYENNEYFFQRYYG